MIVWLAMWSANCRLRAPLALSKIQPRLATRAKAVAITVAAALLTPGCVTNPDFQSLKKNLSTANVPSSSIPGLGGSWGGAKVDGKGVEKKLNEILLLTSQAIGAFSSAIGMKEQADEMTKTAECLKAGTCNGIDKLDVISEAGDKVMDKISDLRKQNTKLQADAGKKAAEGLPPAVASFPKWKELIDEAKTLSKDKSAALQFPSLIGALPKMPAAAANQGKMINTGLEYLTFNGIKHDLKPVDLAVLSGL